VRSTHVNQRLHNTGGSGGQAETYENEGEQVGERENSQGDWSVITDVHVLGYPESVLPLNMAKYDQRSTATSVET